MYQSGACTTCGADGTAKLQSVFERKYIERFKKGNPNADHAVADQVFQYFAQKISFGRIMKMIKGHGRQAVYRIWNDVKQADAKNEIALFLYKIKHDKIIWKD